MSQAINIAKKKSLTMIELAIAMVLGSILALTFGILLFHNYRGWFRAHDAVNLQRDLTFAMDMISRSVHKASESQISASGSTLTIDNVSFYATGARLWYDPDTAISGNEMQISNATISTLSFSKDAAEPAVLAQMVASDNGYTQTLNSRYTYRN